MITSTLELWQQNQIWNAIKFYRDIIDKEDDHKNVKTIRLYYVLVVGPHWDTWPTELTLGTIT